MDFHGLTDVNVGGADDKVVEGHHGELNLVALSKVEQVDLAAELLRHVETLAGELDVCLLVGLVQVVALFAATVARGHGRVVGHLLGQVLEVISHKLKCFPQERIKGLGGSPFADCQRCDHMNGHEGMSPDGVLFFGCEIEQVVVLHGLCTLLQETCWVVEVDGHGHSRKVFSDHVFDYGPDAGPRIRIFQPRQSRSLQWFIRIARLDVPHNKLTVVSDFHFFHFNRLVVLPAFDCRVSCHNFLLVIFGLLFFDHGLLHCIEPRLGWPLLVRFLERECLEVVECVEKVFVFISVFQGCCQRCSLDH